MERAVKAAEGEPERYGRVLEAINSERVSIAYDYEVVARERARGHQNSTSCATLIFKPVLSG
jgi:hypothetical protein